MAGGRVHYLGAWLDADGFTRVVKDACLAADVATRDLPEGVRCRDTGAERFWINHDTEAHEVDGLLLPPASVTRIALA